MNQDDVTLLHSYLHTHVNINTITKNIGKLHTYVPAVIYECNCMSLALFSFVIGLFFYCNVSATL